MRLITILLFVTVLLTPIATAEITIDDFSTTLYNYGDNIILSGELTQSATLRAHLTLSLTCQNTTAPLLTKIVDLKENTPQPYSHLLTIPEAPPGPCTFDVALTDTTTLLLEQQASEDFVITNDLKGTFEPLSQGTYQLGEKLNLKGSISKYNNLALDGTATLFFTKQNTTISRDVTSLSLGALSFTKDLSLLPPGVYTISIHAKDSDGNQRIFTDVYSFTLEGDITLTTNLEKGLYLPGEHLTITGSATSKSGAVLKDILATFTLDGKETNTQTLKTSNDFYKFTLPLSKTIKSGPHTILIQGRDDRGNLGEALSNFTIQAIPTTLKLQLSQTSFLPIQPVSSTTILLDQANDLMTEALTLTLLDPEGKITAQKLVQANADNTLDAPPQAQPGQWTLKLEGFGLTDKQPLTIQEHKHLTLTLKGQELSITNTGNIRFKEYLNINSATIPSGRNLNLKLGEVTMINLNTLFDPGNATISIPFTGQTFEGVEILGRPGLFSGLTDITGNVVGNLESPARKTLLILGFLTLIVALLFLLKPARRRVIKEEIVIQPKYKAMHEEAYIPREPKKEPEKSRYGIADEKDIEDFKRRMKKMFEEEERNKQRSSYTSYNNYPTRGDTPTRNEPQGNVFDMFK